MAKKESTLRCVATLTVIAVVCALMLSVLNFLLYVEAGADDLVGVYPKLDGYVWSVEETAQGDYGAGGKISVVALGKKDGAEDYIGVIVNTEKNGKLNPSAYAMFFNKSTDTLEYAAFITEGATGGFDWEYAEAHAGGDDVSTGATALTALLSDENATEGAKLKTWSQLVNVKITSESVLDFTSDIPKTGATRTVAATYNAFNMAARYYYNVYVKGVKS